MDVITFLKERFVFEDFKSCQAHTQGSAGHCLCVCVLELNNKAIKGQVQGEVFFFFLLSEWLIRDEVST